MPDQKILAELVLIAKLVGKELPTHAAHLIIKFRTIALLKA
jgi:hypothetical protein